MPEEGKRKVEMAQPLHRLDKHKGRMDHGLLSSPEEIAFIFLGILIDSDKYLCHRYRFLIL